MWPNDDTRWTALADGEWIEQGGKRLRLSVVGCGNVALPTGLLVACDPFIALGVEDEIGVRVPPGVYPVQVTLADVSGAGDGSHVREAYATVLLSDAPEVRRKVLVPPGESRKLELGVNLGVGVDSAHVCLVDGGSVARGMPDPSRWYEDVFESGRPDSWFARLDDPGHVREGIANVPLPLATDGANIVLVHSGWGDGVYPLVVGYDAADEPARVHVDFMVVGFPSPFDETS